MAKKPFSKFADECRKALGGGVKPYSEAYVEDAGTHRNKHPAELGKGPRQGGQKGDQQRQPALNEER
jgi:hypothetical protein